MNLLTRKELASRLRISPATVARGIAAGTIPVIRFGGSVRIAETEAVRLEKEGFRLPGVKRGA